MGITAKELAKELGISAAAVSLALNDKPGVSTETRKRIKEAAERLGYDFHKIKLNKKIDGSIYFIICKRNGTVLTDTPFFAELADGVLNEGKSLGYKLNTIYTYEDELDDKKLSDIKYSDCIGMIILGTEITAPSLEKFIQLNLPLVLLDSYIEQIDCDCVQINNIQGAYIATMHLIKKTKKQPGHLASSYPINNFQERREGFTRAIRSSGMSITQSITHWLTPSMDGAYSDMIELIKRKEPLASCYFADNDLIAAGAMKAFIECGYRIPEDIAIVGFDNMPISRMTSPSLTTINVPKQDMGAEAMRRLHFRIHNPNSAYTKTEIITNLVDRYSC